MSKEDKVIVPENLGSFAREDLVALVARLDAENRALRGETQAVLLEKEELKKYLGPQAVEYILTGKHADILKVTMLYLDIEGFTAFSGDLDKGKGDAERLLSAVNPIYQIAIDIFQRKYSGHVNKFIGDAVLATFGAPGSTPNQEEAAVKAALEFQGRFQQYCSTSGIDLKARIGIKTGYVISGTLGADTRKQVDVLGNNVNLSQRIEDYVKEAKPKNGILVDEETWKATRNLAIYGKQFTFTPKGKSETITVHELLGTVQHQIRYEEEKVRLYEREKEIAALDAFKAEVALGNPKIVSITGDSGTGKTELAKHMLLSDSSFYKVSEYCNPLEQSATFSLIGRIARQILGTEEQKVKQRISELGLEESSVLPYYSALIGKTFEGHEASILAENPKEEIIKLFTELVIRESRYRVTQEHSGLILYIDDLQNIDKGSQEALDDLAARISTTEQFERLLLVQTHHKSYTKRYSDKIHTALSLDPLHDSSNLANLVGDIIGKDPKLFVKNIITQLSEVTGGDPVYIKELARAIKQEYDDEKKYSEFSEPKRLNAAAYSVLKAFEQKDKPILDKIADQIVARAKGLGEWAFLTMQLMSVAGKVSYKNDLSQLVNFVPDYSLLIMAGFLSPTARNLEFAHDKIWRAFYQSIPPEERKHLHRRFAEIIAQANKDNPELVAHKIAYHYDNSDQREKAVPFYEIAAKRSLAVFGNEEVIKIYERIFEIESDLLPIEHIEKSLERRISDLFSVANTHVFRTSRFDEARKGYDKVIAIAERMISLGKIAIMRASNGIGLSYIREKKYDRAQVVLERAEQLANELNHLKLPDILVNLGMLYDRKEESERKDQGMFKQSQPSENSEAYLQKSEDYYRRAIGLAEKTDLTHIFAQSYINLAIVLMKQGKISDALEYCDLAETLNIKLNRLDDTVHVKYIRGSIYRWHA
ncbi:TPA: AAA family ATPase, partial [Candidatus Woesearchaeota archaeon]|nr:AAA family ATPase [Candidatus Woesearchaeota archaeon]